MDVDIDTHSHPSDEVISCISYLGNMDDQSVPVMQRQPYQMQPRDHIPPVKLEPYPQNIQQNLGNIPTAYYGNQPLPYYQNPPSSNYPQSPNPQSSHLLHQTQSPGTHMPPSPGIMPSIDQPSVGSPNPIEDISSSETSVILEKINTLQRSQKEEYQKIRQIQKQVMQVPNKQSFDMLDLQHRNTKEEIEAQLKTLQQIYTSKILLPSEINSLLILVQELKTQQTQLELYRQELHQLTQPHAPARCIATLVVSQEPFPMVITKGKQLDEDSVVVQLLCGANVEFQSFSQMKVAMIWENHQSKSNNQKTIDCDTQTVDAFNRVAKWNLKFLNGTRKNSVSLRFGMQVQVQVQQPSPVMVTVESHSTRPFIVITNECQWEESEGTLLKKDAFGEQAEIPWPQFANVLQRHFLRATRQDSISPIRSLSAHDFEYIHQVFFNSQQMITPAVYDQFWDWFGKSIKKLRYQRHILPLWQEGLIHGFLSRQNVHNLLHDQEAGTFLVRFSERHSGQFAVAYRISNGKGGEELIRHYLVQPDDTAGNKKTLPDFLSEQHYFRHLLQISVQSISTGATSYKKSPKDEALSTYTSKRSSATPAVGYDSNIIAYHAPMVSMEQDILDAE